MPGLNAKTTLSIDSVLADKAARTLTAIVEHERARQGDEIFWANVGQRGQRILGQLAGCPRGEGFVVLAFSLIQAIEAWPDLARELEGRSGDIVLPGGG